MKPWRGERNKLDAQLKWKRWMKCKTRKHKSQRNTTTQASKQAKNRIRTDRTDRKQHETLQTKLCFASSSFTYCHLSLQHLYQCQVFSKLSSIYKYLLSMSSILKNLSLHVHHTSSKELVARLVWSTPLLVAVPLTLTQHRTGAAAGGPVSAKSSWGTY